MHRVQRLVPHLEYRQRVAQGAERLFCRTAATFEHAVFHLEILFCSPPVPERFIKAVLKPLRLHLRPDKVRLEPVCFNSILLQLHVKLFISKLPAVLELAAIGHRLGQHLLRMEELTFGVFSSKARLLNGNRKSSRDLRNVASY